ncbi:scavenger receptor cysteine-rich domain superfamily protein [Chanos chanos]|uniref:Scavenger receptor cysteine-rich domain superfamily protein n=1 Tax=Chanos chanos TaxID=29144 RepID=A0A6J2WA72_CHACN|nr:scavenger receptor cysteine-rich domain superfamily protein-like [Chanos chanos]
MSKILRVLTLLSLGYVIAVWDAHAYDDVHTRLVGGDHKCSGRVEVYLGNHWGTVCNHGWDLRDAAVVCRELSCGFAYSTSHAFRFGRASGEVVWRNVRCSGDEFSLDLCERTLNDGICLHNEDVSVECTVEIHTPQIWYNTSAEAPSGWVLKGQNFNVTCSTQQGYPGGSFQLRFIRPNGTVRHTLPALSNSVTFTFSNAQSSNEGYYCCLYKVQVGGRMFISRESQPLPISVKGITKFEYFNFKDLNSADK